MTTTTEREIADKESVQYVQNPAINEAIDLDRSILNILQMEFPLVRRPFAAIAERLNATEGTHLTEAEVLAQVRGLKESRIIRQVSAIFDTRALGYTSSLVSMHIPDDHLEAAAAIINSHPGVSHNYKRNHYFNLWFTLAVPPGMEFQPELDRLAKLAEVEIYRRLQNLRMFKIGVKLDMTKDETELEPQKIADVIKARPASEITERDKEFIRALQKDIQLVEEPFDVVAAEVGVSVDELFAQARQYVAYGWMRRFAAILRHQQAGFTANGMVCWKVPEDRVEAVGLAIAEFPQVSHLYQRPLYPDWQYNIFSMVHAREVANCEKIAQKIEEKIDVHDYVVLYSTKEYKKTRVEYFVDWNGEVTYEEE